MTEIRKFRWQQWLIILGIEQDYLYWPLKYKALAGQWCANTAWGHLFQRYQEQGTLVP